MKERWIRENVDLDLLCQSVSHFLEEKRFVLKLEKLKNELRVYGWPLDREEGGPVLVKIYGNSNDFTIEFVPGESFRGLRILGPLYSLFGGGSLWLRELRAREFFERLEEQFWVAVDEAVANLRGKSSAKLG